MNRDNKRGIALLVLTFLALASTLVLTGFGGGALAQGDPTPTLSDRSVRAADGVLVARYQIDATTTGATFGGDGVPIVVAGGNLWRVGPDGRVEPMLTVADVVTFSGMAFQDGAAIQILGPVISRGGPAALPFAITAGDGAIAASGMLLDDGSLWLLGHSDGGDMDLVRGEPGGSTVLSLTSFSELEPIFDPGTHYIIAGVVAPIVAVDGGPVIKFEPLDGRAGDALGWFEPDGTLNLVGGEGQTLAWVRVDPVGDVQSVQAQLGEGTALPIDQDWYAFPAPGGGLHLIVPAADGQAILVTVDAAGAVLASQPLPARLGDDTLAPLILSMPDDEALILLPDPAVPGGLSITRVIPPEGEPTFFPMPPIPRPNSGGGGASSYGNWMLCNPCLYSDLKGGGVLLPLVDLEGDLHVVRLDPHTGSGIMFEDPLTAFEDPIIGFEDPLTAFEDPLTALAPPLIWTPKPDGFLLARRGGNVVYACDDAGNQTEVTLTDVPDGITGLGFGADGLLYITDRSGAVSVYDY